MNAVIAVVGKDTTGILATVSSQCTVYNANIVEVSQTVLKDYFAMIMVVNIDNLNCSFEDFVDSFANVKTEKNLEIHIMHEDIFNAMHKI
ncbi:MAG: ACT domain-containing protein [Acholeplasmatales bacterium]|nr:ACT domain-containing protein [Acholeplasmatales bacterium]